MVDPKAQEELAQRHESAIARVLRTGMMGAIDRYAVEDVLALPDNYRNAVEAVLSEVWADAARQGSNAVVFTFKDCFPRLETKADEETLFEQILKDFIERFGATKVTQIVQATRDQLFRIVQRGQREGLGLNEIAAQMREAVPDLSRLRSHVIARTETHTSGTYAAQQVARTSRRPLVKKWVSVADSRTRDFGEGDGVVDEFSHRAMDGVTLPLNEPYMVPTKFGTKEPIMFPGDPNASPGNSIMCRCVEIYERQKE